MKHLSAAIFFLLGIQIAAAAPAGFRALTIPAEHHGRAMSGALWYPSSGNGRTMNYGENAVFRGTPVLDGARPADGPFPVIVVSHGLGGHMGTIGWLTAGLAEAGALVVAVNHPNGTWRDFDLQKAMKHWTRVLDLQAALAYLAAHPDFAAHADFSRIYAVGFSAGGWTALSMGGLRADLEGYAAHCKTAPASPYSCADLTGRGADLRAFSPENWNASRKDDRIRAVAAVDPALTHGLGRAHARDLVDKVLLIGLGTAETRLPATDFGKTGSGLAAHLPRAEIEIMAPAAHFTALSPCKPRGAAILAAEGDDPLCDDPPGTDRVVAAPTDRGTYRGFPRSCRRLGRCGPPVNSAATRCTGCSRGRRCGRRRSAPLPASARWSRSAPSRWDRASRAPPRRARRAPRSTASPRR